MSGATGGIVSESSGSPRLRSAVVGILQLSAAAALTLLSAPAGAGPEQGTVVRGAASIEATAPGVLDINQSTDRAVINWRSFSIGAQEAVRFNQPASTSATLNRVLGGQRSLIEGLLSANGQVFLLNPSGVLFSSAAKVDVGGLVVTTSALADEDFLAGRLEFAAAAAPGAQVINAGTISIRDGGMAALVAPSVRNQGVITARLGRIALGAGETYALDLFGDQMINFALPAPGGADTAPRVLEQSGAMIADSGRVLLTTDAAAGIVDGVVNMSGIVQARSVAQLPTGEILLAGGDAAVTVSGTLDASGKQAATTGGSIGVYGDSVNLTSAAVVDASGSLGGGIVRIGGGASGEDTARARSTAVAAGATIDVSATATGDAGTATLWGTESNSFAGTILARGGAGGGNGGFVEVSSRGLLQFLGDAITDSASGQAGVVLLDPPTIRVEAAGSLDPNAAVVSAAALNAMLRRGTPVVLLADDSITVNAVIDGRSPDGAGPSGLVQMTAGSIVLMQPILTERNSIALSATAGNVTFGANAYLYVADSTAASGVGSSAIAVAAQGSVQAGSLISLGQVSVTAATGNVVLPGQFGLNNAGTATGIGSLTVNAGSNVTLQGTSASGAVTVTAGGSVSNSTASIIAGGNVALTAGTAGITLGAISGNAAAIDAVGSGATVSLLTPGAVVLNSSIRTAGGNLSIGANTPAGRVGSLTSGAGTVLRTDGGGRVDIFALDNVSLRGIASGGPVLVDTLGRLTNVDGSIVSTTGGITLAAGGDADAGMDLRSSGASVAAVDAGGARVDLLTTGAVTVGGGIRVLNGAIGIGSAAGRVASLDLLPGAALQTYAGTDRNGSIDIFSAGGVAAGGGATPVGLITGALNIDSSAGAVNLDGLFGVAAGANGIGSLTINAIGAGGDVTLRGVRTSGAINVTASGEFTNSAGSIISAGDVNLTAGGITLAALSETAPGIDATGTGANVSLQSSGGAVALGSGIRTAGGNIAIGANSSLGRVRSVIDSTGIPADTVPSLRTGGAGNVSVYATDAVTLHGVAAGGAITVDTSGKLTNTDNSIVAAGGAVALTAGGDAGEGMDLRAGTDSVAVIEAAAGTGVSLRTDGGTVTLGGGIRALGGAITVGTSTTRVAALNLLPGAKLQTFTGATAGGSIDIFSSAGFNGVDATAAIGLIAGALRIDSASGNVSLDGLFGLDNAGVASGIGSLTVNAGGTVDLRGTKTSGNVDVTAGGTITAQSAPIVAGGSLSLQTPGAVSLVSDLRTAAGNITIGSAATPAGSLIMAADAQLRTDSGDIAISTGAGGIGIGSIVGGPATGVTVRSGGNLQILGTLSGPNSLDRLEFFDAQAANIPSFRGVRTAGQSATGEGIRLVVPLGGSVDVLGALDSVGGSILLGLSNANALTNAADYGTGGNNARINLSNSIFTANQSITINGDVTLFQGIDRWMLQAALDAPGGANALLAGAFTLAPRGFTAINDCDNGNGCGGGNFFTHNPSVLCVVSGNCVFTPDDPDNEDTNNPGTFFQTLQFFGGDEGMRFAGSDFAAYDNNGHALTAINTGACGAWICGYRATASSSPALRLAADAREDGMRQLLGVLTSTIDTNAAGGSGASVTVRGNLGRYAPTNTQIVNGVTAVYASFVNHELQVDVGAGHTLTVNGVLGDTVAQADATGRNNIDSLNGGILTSNQMPTLGMFQINAISGGATSNAGGGFANSTNGGVSNVTATTGQYSFNVPWTSPSPGGPSSGTPGGSPTFNVPTFDNSPGGIGTLSAGNAGSSGTPVGGVGSQGAGAGGTGTATGVAGSGTSVSLSPAPVTFGVLSTAGSQERTDNAENVNGGDDSQAQEQSTDRCARGAAQVADLGATQAVDGVAADVFARCPEGQ